MSDTQSGVEKPSTTFWSALENIIRPSTSTTGSSQQQQQQQQQQGNAANNRVQDSLDHRLNRLKSHESIQTRLKNFEELIRLSDSYNYNENFLNSLMQSVRDLFKIECTPIEHRKVAFESLLQLYQKQSEKFETFLLKNHLLSFVINNDSSSKCLFLYTLNLFTVLDSPTETTKTSPTAQQQKEPVSVQHKSSESVSPTDRGEDLKLRLNLFNAVTKQGTSMRHLDPELTTECLIYFLLNAKNLSESAKYILKLFDNIINQRYFQYLDDNLLFLLTEFILDFSHVIAKTLELENNSVGSSGKSSEMISIAAFNRQQQLEIENCVGLAHNLISHLTTIDSVKHIVLALCELLDIVCLNEQTHRSPDPLVNTTNEKIVSQTYLCMSQLFNSHIGNCSIFTFFSQVFQPSGKYKRHRAHQITGALRHIKQLFDDFRPKNQTPDTPKQLKNTFLIKQLHLSCLVYLPSALKSCCNSADIRRPDQLKIFELILVLTIDLVHLANHRDLFMCLSTFNSRKFLIEIIEQFSVQIEDNKQLIQKYAELLNLLDKKDVFSYKTNNTTLTPGPLSPPGSSSQQQQHSQSASPMTNDEIAANFQKFKKSFYELVYKFPHIHYLTEACVNKCIEFYLLHKLRPCFNLEAIEGIRSLLDKFYGIKQCQNLIVRKFVLGTLTKKLHDYNKNDQKFFAEDVIRRALLPICELSLGDDNAFYHSLDSPDDNGLLPNAKMQQQFHSDLLEIKHFMVSKLIELSQICADEQNILKIIDILEQILLAERTCGIETLNVPLVVLTPVSTVSATGLVKTTTSSGTSATSTLSPPNSSSTTGVYIHPANLNQNFNYLNKIIQALIDLFEKHFGSHCGVCLTRSCARIFTILTNYLENYYNPSVNVNMSNNNTQPQQRLTPQQQQQQSMFLFAQQAHSKFFNYYAQIRRDIFEFLLRIRSDKNNNRMVLVNRSDRRKHFRSKYLILDLEDTSSSSSAEHSVNEENCCLLNFTKILNLVEMCMDKEIDWNVLVKVLHDLPFILQYEMNLIKDSEFLINVFKYFYKRDIATLRNRPETLTRSEYVSKFYPLIASLVLYHPILERSSQENILQNFAMGISSYRFRFCLETLTIAITEMHETNAKTCAEILLKLSQFSPSQNMAQPVLELLSTISDLKKFDSTIFDKKEFISVSAIAIRYTDPLKFNPFIILLAHYVICIWFIKCNKDFRKNYASFTCKGLYQEVIVQLERLNKQQQATSQGLKGKSPSRIFSEQETNQQHQSSLNQNLTAKFTNPGGASSSGATLSNEPSTELKTNLTENMKVFYKELVEITLDFMANNMFFDNTASQQLTTSHNNQNKFIVDVCTNPCLARNSSMIENTMDLIKGGYKSSNATKTSQSRSWIIANKIIQIKTGLFSNICVEESSSHQSRKHRLTNSSSKSKKASSSTTTAAEKAPPTQPVNIPNNKNLLQLQQAASSGGNSASNAESFESNSESSQNNSFSSHGLATNQATGSDSQASSASTKNATNFLLARSSSLGPGTGKEGNDSSVSSLATRSEQELFDDMVDSSNETTAALMSDSDSMHKPSQTDRTITSLEASKPTTPAAITDASTAITSSYSSKRRNQLTMKRRYKSGIPLNNDRNDDDPIEETYLKNFYDSINSKTSKDDSDISLTSSLSSKTTTAKNNENHHHQKDALLYHSSSDGLMLSDGLAPNSNNVHVSKTSSLSHRHHHHKHSHHHRHQSAQATYNVTNDNRLTNDGKAANGSSDVNGSSSAKTICHSSCWCNNLVEVTIRYPTKVVSYVTLIDNNNCVAHDLNPAAFDQSQRVLSKATATNVAAAVVENDHVEAVVNVATGPAGSDAKKNVSSNMVNSLSAIAASAVDLRKRMSLSRISESSPLQEPPITTTSTSDTQTSTITNASSSSPDQRRNSQLLRKASFDSKLKPETNKTNSSHLSGVLDPEVIEREEKLQHKAKEPSHKNISEMPSKSTNPNQQPTLNNTYNKNSSNHKSNSKASSSLQVNGSQNVYNMMMRQQKSAGVSQSASNPLDPSQVFLHLFQNHHSNVAVGEKDHPLVIPEIPTLQRSMILLENLPCYLTHKIGVIYVGKNQAHDEKAILSNANGSLRYKSFVNGLGNLIRLKDLDTNRYYSGGLETDGSAGEFTLLWFDGLIQVVYHIATMMPLSTNANNVNTKKKHIGNDSTIIVYNESGEEYQFNMIKGEVNCICIEIEPLKSNTNVVTVKTTNELAQSGWINQQEQKFVSDQNLATITRKMALHADLATKCYRFQKDGNGMNPYGGKWYERLKQINRIRKSCTEYYSKQQKPNNNESGSGGSSGKVSQATSSVLTKAQTIENQMDFTEYI